MDSYVPALFAATESVKVPWEEKLNLASKGIGVVIKIVYAFCYQEKKLPTFINNYFDSKNMTIWGGEHIEMINGIADAISGFYETDINVMESFDLYPG